MAVDLTETARLMEANLLQVFNERDPARRREVIARTYTADMQWTDDYGTTWLRLPCPDLGKDDNGRARTLLVRATMGRDIRTEVPGAAYRTTVALANSLFFSAATSEARTKILLYLLLTLAPFALVAPFLGRLLDHSRGGRRLLMVVINLLRGVVAFVLARLR